MSAKFAPPQSRGQSGSSGSSPVGNREPLEYVPLQHGSLQHVPSHHFPFVHAGDNRQDSRLTQGSDRLPDLPSRKQASPIAATVR
jgi:hypothetical protein